jgi:metal-responsive CopG/Arc/MetJ family transcriptional regulator
MKIEVLLDKELVERLGRVASIEGVSLSVVIRRACTAFLEEKTGEELDAAYALGYLKTPEEPIAADAQVALIETVLPKESW